MAGSQNSETAAAAGRRRRGAVGLFAAVALGWLALVLLRPPATEPVLCGRDLTPGADTVVMLSASWCSYCRRARAWLVEREIAYCEFDVETSDEGRRRFAAAPARVVPIIEIRGDTLVGFNRTEIEQTLIAHGLADFGD